MVDLPVQFVTDRYLFTRDLQAPFIRQATPFQDFVIRCVRYTFACIPTNIGRVFFSKWVVIPWLRWRMLRHGYLWSFAPWKEFHLNGLEGIWIGDDNIASYDTDILIYYCHGTFDAAYTVCANNNPS